MRTAAVALMITVLVGCGDDDPAPGLFESQGVIDWDPVATRAELAAMSDTVVIGTLVDVDDGYMVGSSIDDEFGSPEIELVIDTVNDEPMRLLWYYAPGFSLDQIRDAFPIGARVVVYATRFVVPESDQGSYHHIGDVDHVHWRWTNPQGLIVEDPDTGDIVVYNSAVTFDDAPAGDAELEAWFVEPLAFEDPVLAGLCEDMISDFVEGEPSPHSTEAQAVARFAVEHSILDGLDLVDGTILLRGGRVGSYRVVSRPGDTFAVASAGWCFPNP